VSGKNITKNCGEESDRKSAMRDPSFELGRLSIGIVEVDGIKVSNGSGEKLDIFFRDRLCEISRIADFQFVNGLPLDHIAHDRSLVFWIFDLRAGKALCRMMRGSI
jgi:hypothetical protein